MSWRLKLYREEQFLMKVGIEFHVRGELWLKARRPKSVDKYGTCEVSGLKNGEPVMAGVLGGDYKDRMADRLLRSYR